MRMRNMHPSTQYQKTRLTFPCQTQDGTTASAVQHNYCVDVETQSNPNDLAFQSWAEESRCSDDALVGGHGSLFREVFAETGSATDWDCRLLLHGYET